MRAARMDQKLLEKMLKNLPMGGIRYYQSVGSTNDVAAKWAEQGAEDFSLVIADTQTNGRGRNGRKWFSSPGSGLALSLILQNNRGKIMEDVTPITRYTGLGALAVCKVLQNHYSLPARIKWPNDVLIHHQKCCGVLVEAQWSGNQLSSIILGIGVNISETAIPPAEDIHIAATSVATILSAPVDRLVFLQQLLLEISSWRSRLWEDSFLQTWTSNLAFLGEEVQIALTGISEDSPHRLMVGQIMGLNKDGALILKNETGEDFLVHVGEISTNQIR